MLFQSLKHVSEQILRFQVLGASGHRGFEASVPGSVPGRDLLLRCPDPGWRPDAGPVQGGAREGNSPGRHIHSRRLQPRHGQGNKPHDGQQVIHEFKKDVLKITFHYTVSARLMNVSLIKSFFPLVALIFRLIFNNLFSSFSKG